MDSDWKWHIRSTFDMSKEQAAEMLGCDPDDVVIEAPTLSARYNVDYWAVKPRVGGDDV